MAGTVSIGLCKELSDRSLLHRCSRRPLSGRESDGRQGFILATMEYTSTSLKWRDGPARRHHCGGGCSGELEHATKVQGLHSAHMRGGPGTAEVLSEAHSANDRRNDGTGTVCHDTSSGGHTIYCPRSSSANRTRLENHLFVIARTVSSLPDAPPYPPAQPSPARLRDGGAA